MQRDTSSSYLNINKYYKESNKEADSKQSIPHKEYPIKMYAKRYIKHKNDNVTKSTIKRPYKNNEQSTPNKVYPFKMHSKRYILVLPK